MNQSSVCNMQFWLDVIRRNFFVPNANFQKHFDHDPGLVECGELIMDGSL